MPDEDLAGSRIGGQPPISVGTAVLSGDAEKKVQSIGTKVANLAWRVLAASNAQCEQCNHTHTDSQYCECYRIVVQPMQESLELREKDKMPTFTGDVYVLQGDTEMHCKQLVVFYEEETGARTVKAADPLRVTCRQLRSS